MSLKSRHTTAHQDAGSYAHFDKPYDNVKLVNTDDKTIRKLVEFSLNFKAHSRVNSKKFKRDLNDTSPRSRKLRVQSAYDECAS